MTENIISNALRTPDGTIIHSRHRHDYVTYTDANGNEYMIDGGLDYVRSSAHGDEEHLTVTTKHPHELVREECVWGTYGPQGDQPLTYKKLSDMSDSHIDAVLENVRNIKPAIKTAMQNEVEYRNDRKSI
tara:strand:+ start:651 stop:1040 length:390 start_codon:yes stop_codon:yes gene_type:complete